MADLAVIQLTPGVMTDNLNESLEQPGSKPWGFPSFLSTMNGIREGVHIAFVRAVRPGGAPVGKSGPYPPETEIERLVVGTVVQSLEKTPTPYFDGFPFAFRFNLVDDLELDPPLDLGDTAERLNSLLPGLGLDAEGVLQVLSNGRSAKVGMFFDGQPRKAEYFKSLASPRRRLTPASDATTPRPAHPRTEPAPLLEAVDDFVAGVNASGLTFGGINEDLPRAFLAALLAKRFVLLTGLSGSGKTQVARALGQWLGHDDLGPCHLVVPVRADWTSPDPLLGYEDALLPSRGSRRAWSVPPALQFMIRASQNPHRLYLLVLDEMNLAHVERYFADVLSGMESGEPVVPNVAADSDGVWHADAAVGTVALPDNLLLVGTVNVDETTYQFSPKVLDRSFSIEFRVSTDELSGSLRALRPTPPASMRHIGALAAVSSDPDWHLTRPSGIAAEVEARLIELHRELTEVGLEFGHRSFREAVRLAAILPSGGVESYESVMDWVVMSKVLPRVHGSRRQLEPFLWSLQSNALGEEPEKPIHPLTARKATRMLESLAANQYAGYAE